MTSSQPYTHLTQQDSVGAHNAFIISSALGLIQELADNYPNVFDNIVIVGGGAPASGTWTCSCSGHPALPPSRYGMPSRVLCSCGATW